MCEYDRQQLSPMGHFHYTIIRKQGSSNFNKKQHSKRKKKQYISECGISVVKKERKKETIKQTNKKLMFSAA